MAQAAQLGDGWHCAVSCWQASTLRSKQGNQRNGYTPRPELLARGNSGGREYRQPDRALQSGVPCNEVGAGRPTQ